jgi:hypothetical protein
MVFQAEDRTKAKRQQSDLAIQLALHGRWTEAAQLNRSIIESFPTDVDACNRLGKAMTELGRYSDARAAYMRTLEIDSVNSIARKNLERLAALGDAAPPRTASQKLSPQMFIEETGKTGVTTLIRLNEELSARMTAGDQVMVQPRNGSLVVQSIDGEYLGEVEPKLSQRLTRLMKGGNEYVAAIAALARHEVRVFIRETFQHGSQTGKLSFPAAVTEPFRPYTRGRLLRQDADDEAYDEDADEADHWAPADDPEDTDTSDDDFGARKTAIGVDRIAIREDDEDE